MEIHILFLVMAIVWGTGEVFRKLKLPIFLGEMLAGVVFGPPLFGVFEHNEVIELLAHLGIFFLMLHAGLETKPKDLLRYPKTSLAIALGGTALPLFAGWGVSRWFGYDQIASVFVGLGVAITAMAVTNRIFREFNVHRTKTAHLVMSATMIGDIMAFLILSVLLGIVDNGGAVEWTNILRITGEVALFFGGALILGAKVMPIFNKVFQRKGHKAFTFTLMIAFAFGAFAELIGLHYILGAYLAGLFVKEDTTNPHIFEKIEDRLFGLSYSFLGPIFFVSLGFHVDFSILSDHKTLGFLVAIIVVSVLGKWFGAGVSAYMAGRPKREAMLIGAGMNGRGAVELIIALIGLELMLIDETIFSVLVFMAFFTTLMTPFTLKYLLKDKESNS